MVDQKFPEKIKAVGSPANPYLKINDFFLYNIFNLI